MASAPTKRVSKACDACKLRKVKCNGQERCQQCSHLGLRCIYSVSTRTRSQGKRGRIITEYKNKTSNTTTNSPSILPAGSESPGQTSPLSVTYSGDQLDREQPSSCHSVDRTAEKTMSSPLSSGPQYGQVFFLDLISDYVEGVYPVQPVIPEKELREYISVMDTDPDIRSFVYSFGACTLNLTRYGDRRTEEVQRTIEVLMNYSIASMKPPYKSFHSSVMRAMQSMFIHNCLMSIQASDAAFHYIRDSITAVQLLRIDSADVMAPLPPPERSRRQRLYWQAFIHERFVAVLDYRQAILPPLDSMPEEDPTIPIQVHEGFIQIIKLFRLLDQDFLKNWTDSQNGNVTSSWIEAKSRELEGDEEANAEELAKLSTMQRADLAITREWLRTLVWRLAMSQALLSSRSSKQCLSLLFPVRLSQNLRHQVTKMSRHDIEVHGSSMTQKLFEITDTIADVLIHVPAASLEETALRIEDYLFILDFVLLFPTLDQTRRSILLEKLERLQSMFPEVCSQTSSPNIPLELQSPHSAANDPWGQVAHSKMGSETAADHHMALAGSLAPAAAPFADLDQAQAQAHGQHGDSTRQARWNHISRRLSMATFSVPAELSYRT